MVANSGLEGLEMIKNNPEITLIITDMQMPHLDGIQFIRKAKEIKPNMPCYILTGYEITPEISDAIKEGLIVEYFKKPLEEDLLERAVHKLNK